MTNQNQEATKAFCAAARYLRAAGLSNAAIIRHFRRNGLLVSEQTIRTWLPAKSPPHNPPRGVAKALRGDVADALISMGVAYRHSRGTAVILTEAWEAEIWRIARLPVETERRGAITSQNDPSFLDEPKGADAWEPERFAVSAEQLADDAYWLPFASPIAVEFWLWRWGVSATALRRAVRMGSRWTALCRAGFAVDDIDAVRWAWDAPVRSSPPRPYGEMVRRFAAARDMGATTDQLFKIERWLRQELITLMAGALDRERSEGDFTTFYAAMERVREMLREEFAASPEEYYGKSISGTMDELTKIFEGGGDEKND